MVKFLRRKNSKTLPKGRKPSQKHSKKQSKKRRTRKPKSKSNKNQNHLNGGQCASCGSALNSNTFRNYMENLENQMSGGGYSVNLGGVNIGNRAVIDRYADTNPPVTDLNGNLLIRLGDAPACGQYGGRNVDVVMNDLNELEKKNKKTHKKKKRKSRKSKKTKKSKKSRKSKSRKSKSRKSKSKSKSRKSKSKLKRGGFSVASNFNEDMKSRKFDCNQPNWSPDCV